jgi:hypothetical protein
LVKQSVNGHRLFPLCGAAFNPVVEFSVDPPNGVRPELNPFRRFALSLKPPPLNAAEPSFLFAARFTNDLKFRFHACLLNRFERI